MASKATKRERRELAKKARMEAQRRAARARRLRKLYSGGVVLVAIAVVVALVVWNNARSKEAVNALNDLATAAGCAELQSPSTPSQPQHVTTDVQYPTDPPTSGDHAGAWWAQQPGGPEVGGPQTTTIPEERLVHNLEHGAVVLHYKPDVATPIKSALDAVATAQPEWVISQPNADMTPQVAFTAWGKLMTCDGTGEGDAIRAVAQKFADTQKQNAPEDVAMVTA